MTESIGHAKHGFPITAASSSFLRITCLSLLIGPTIFIPSLLSPLSPAFLPPLSLSAIPANFHHKSQHLQRRRLKTLLPTDVHYCRAELHIGTYLREQPAFPVNSQIIALILANDLLFMEMGPKVAAFNDKCFPSLYIIPCTLIK